MRPFSTYRQQHGETRLGARLEFAAGTVRVLAGRPSELYRMSLSYDAERFRPLSRYDKASGAVTLGVESSGNTGLRVVSTEHLKQMAVVELSPRTDLSLGLALGASDADLDVGGLRITALQLETGASRTTLRFSAPNPVRCRSATISAGAAEVSVIGLGNSRCDEVQLEGGVGKVLLDFTGTSTPAQRAVLTLAVGELTLRLPRHLGVRISADKFLSRFEPAGLVRRGSDYVTPDFDPSARHLDLVVKTAMGGVKLEWVN